MAIFPKAPYPSTERFGYVGERYRRLLRNRPFLTFGLPFLFTVVAGSFFLTPATAVRYESHDRKQRMLDREEALGLNRVREAGRERVKKSGGKNDIREEYWRLSGQSGKLDDWEPVRVKRLPGEPDGTLD